MSSILIQNVVHFELNFELKMNHFWIENEIIFHAENEIPAGK